LEKVACGAFSDTAAFTPAKGVTFAGCLATAGVLVCVNLLLAARW